MNGRQHSINLNPGAKTGQKFRLAGSGASHPYNAQLPPGDLLVNIHVALNGEFIIDQNNDVWVEVSLPWFDIMAGTKVAINSLDGPISIKVPPGTYPGKTLRIKTYNSFSRLEATIF